MKKFMALFGLPENRRNRKGTRYAQLYKQQDRPSLGKLHAAGPWVPPGPSGGEVIQKDLDKSAKNVKKGGRKDDLPKR